MIRQGEILLVPVTRPEGMKEKAVKSAVLGIGETGNAHTLIGDVKWLYDAADDINQIQTRGAIAADHELFVELFTPGTIEHSDRSDQGHEPLDVPTGIYRVVIKREYTPLTDAPRYVVDLWN